MARSHSMPGYVVAALLLASAASPHSASRFVTPAQTPSGVRVIEITARRFAFDPAQVDVTVGERVRLLVRSADGVHGLEIKRLKVNREIPRGGEPVTIDFTASEAGRFPILCSEYCGDGHGEMSGLLVVSAAKEEERSDDHRASGR